METATRRYDIDWLRIIAMAGIFLLHTMHFFDLGTDWHLRNADQSRIVALLRGVIDVWAIPLFFVLSGAGAWFALGGRTAGRFVVDRAKRLLVPLYTVGLFAIVLPQIYFDAFTNGHRGGFGEAIALNLRSVRFEPGWPGLTTFFTGHLWFLQFLFLVSILVLPLLHFLRGPSGTRGIGRLAGWCAHRGAIFLLAIPLVGVRIALMSLFPGQHTWADLVYFAVLFLIGYVLMADDRFAVSIARGKRSASVALPLTLAGLAVQSMALDYDVFRTPFSPQFALFQALLGTCTWSAIVLLMDAAARHLRRPSRFLTYANEAVLPFYIFHQTVILGIGWFVIRWNLGILPKLVIVTVTSFLGTMILYDAFVRDSSVLRVLFGMRGRKAR